MDVCQCVCVRACCGARVHPLIICGRKDRDGIEGIITVHEEAQAEGRAWIEIKAGRNRRKDGTRKLRARERGQRGQREEQSREGRSERFESKRGR